jgi:hypothetical protein
MKRCLATHNEIGGLGHYFWTDLTRLAPSLVTLSAAKGLKYRFFAALRMTFLEIYTVKRTNILCFDLVFAGNAARIPVFVFM